MIMKLAWGLIHKPNVCWVRVLKDKYKCGMDIMPEVREIKGCYVVWKSIYSMWEHVHKGLLWILRNGNLT